MQCARMRRDEQGEKVDRCSIDRRYDDVLEEEAEAEVGRVLLHEGPRLEHQRLLLLAEDDVPLRERHASSSCCLFVDSAC